MVILGLGAGQVHAQTPSLGFSAAYPTGENTTAIAVADINHDNHLDLIVAACDNNLVRVRLGDGLGGFGSETDFTTGLTPRGLAIADLNGDTHPGIATANATASFSLPAGTSAQTLTVTAAYSGSADFAASSGTSALVVSAASSATAGANASATFNAADQTVPLSATVTSEGGTVNAGTVTFTVRDAGSAIVGAATTSGTVSGGAASANYTLPGGTAAQTLTITAVYNGSTDFAPSTDATHTLTIGAAASATVAPDVSATFNAASQSVLLSATVTSPGGVVNAGTVTFTLRALVGGAIVGVATTSGTVSGGAASVNYTLPGGTGAQTHPAQLGVEFTIFRIIAAYNGSTNFLTSTDATHGLFVHAAPSATAAANASAPFSAASQSVPLSATVTSPNGTPVFGNVTFTVRDAGSAIVGAPTTSPNVLPGGAASVNYTLPGGTAVQTLTITAVYNGSTNFATSTDATHTLTIGAAASTIVAPTVSTPFNWATRSVRLSATVTSPGGVVNAGTVTFTLRNSTSGMIAGVSTTSGTVSGGAASVDYTLGGGMGAQSSPFQLTAWFTIFTITAVYSGSTDFLPSTDASHFLFINAAPSVTAAADASATFSAASQSVPLSATVTGGNGVVWIGTVTFTVRDAGSAIVGAATTSGNYLSPASVNYTLPAGTNAQTLTITAVYNGSTNFRGSTDATHTLTVGPAVTTTAAAGGSVLFSAAAQSVPLTATVTSGAGPVGTGIVTFTARTAANVVVGSSVTGAVVGGAASATYTLPGGTPAQTLTVTASYGATTNFSGSAGTAALSIGCPAIAIGPGSAPAPRLGRPFSLTFTASPLTDATFTLIGTGPSGLSFSGATLSGTPVALGRYIVTAQATSPASGCTATRAYTFDVMRPATFVTGPGGGAPLVRAFDELGTETHSFLSDAPPFAGAVRVAMGDVTGDGVADTITAPGLGSASAIVRVFDGVTGVQVRQFVAFPSAPPGGVYVAAGDVNADGVADIIAGRDGDLPEVRLFDGRTGRLVSDFFAYTPGAVGGVRVAAGDLNGDGLAEIITGTPPGAPPEVRVFSGDGAPLAAFMAYDPAFGGGVYVAAGDVDGDGRADIVTGAGAGGGPHVRVFSGADLHELRGFFAYAPAFTGGVRVAAGDLDLDGHAEIMTAAGAGGGPHVRVWDGATGAETLGFFAYDPAFTEGVFVAAAPPQSRMAIDTPAPGATVGPVFPIGGWAAQGTATTDSGVDAIHVWAYPVTGAAPIFVGAATLGTERPDVAGFLGGIFANAGYSLEAGPLPAGTYDLVVFVRNARSGVFSDRRLVRIVVTP